MKFIIQTIVVILILTSCEKRYNFYDENNNDDKFCISDYINIQEDYEVDSYVRDFEFDKKGNIWITTNNELLHINGTDYSLIKKYDYYNSILSENLFAYLSIDNENNIWITNRRDLFKYSQNNNTFYKYSYEDYFSNTDYISTVYVSTNNILYILDRYNLYELKDEKWMSILQSSTINKDYIYFNSERHCFIKQDSIFWIPTSNGLLKYESNIYWTLYDTTNSEIQHNNVVSVNIDNQKRIWLLTSVGIQMFEDNNWTIFNDLSRVFISNDLILANKFYNSSYKQIMHFQNNHWEYYLIGYFDGPTILNDLEHDKVGNIWLLDNNNALIKLISNL